MKETLSILGASARAAAISAVRADYAVCAVDLFADRDTQAIADTLRIADYPAGFLTAVEKMPPGPWIYTGGLENYPEVIDAIAASRLLWGNAGGVLRAVRDPLVWTKVLATAKVPALPVTRDISDVPRDGSWLAKPLRSSGGFGIRVVGVATRSSFSYSLDYYFQRRAAGISASLVFVAARRRAVLLGATQQLCGEPWAGAAPFVYAGSIGPTQFDGVPTTALQRIGDVLAEAFDLTGLFGVDGVVNDEGFWPVEVNPRYVASIEVLERATGANFLQFHTDACRHAALPARDFASAGNTSICGKAVVFSRQDATFGEAVAAWVARANAGQLWPVVADIPAVGELLSAGGPVVTLLAFGSNHEAVAAQFRQRCAELHRMLATEPQNDKVKMQSDKEE